MSIASILALADQAKAALATSDRQYPPHVGLPCDVLIEAARQIREREERVHHLYRVIDSTGLGLPRSPIDVMTKDVVALIHRQRDEERQRLADAQAVIEAQRRESDEVRAALRTLDRFAAGGTGDPTGT